MSSANEELQPQPKPPRASPLDFRNTDLVSRLLAATPPYLYNMPIVPNSYFFSEMLRSFVQAKTDQQQNVTGRLPGAAVHHHHHHQRRPRKRSWTQARAEYYQRDTPKSPPKPEQPTVSLIEPFTASPYDTKRLIERPLELTMGKIGLNNNNNNSNNNSGSSCSTKMSESVVSMTPSNNNPHYACALDTSSKQELPGITQPPLMFPAVPQANLNQDASTHPNLMLPPPPPIWYPPLYPPPYGFDPLHFFIDLRVSGHIYDRKNDKDDGGDPPHTATQPPEEAHHHNKFQQSRHMSAFSVPIPGNTKNIPMNLSSNSKGGKEERKFDVKSMGFETTRNLTGSNYIMSNIGRIYRELGVCKVECEKEKNGGGGGVVETREEETEEEIKEKKRVKDLRALIGLELVVDYMNQAKPPTGGGRRRSDNRDSEESSSTDVEESSADSPSVEVVACGNEEGL